MNGQINQIIAETHLNSLFCGLATVLPTPCQNKNCIRRERWGERLNQTIYHPTHTQMYRFVFTFLCCVIYSMSDGISWTFYLNLKKKMFRI